MKGEAIRAEGCAATPASSGPLPILATPGFGSGGAAAALLFSFFHIGLEMEVA